jgi:ankyrin repeat protein
LESKIFSESPKVLIVQELLKFEANPDAMDNDGQTPLHLAIQGGHLVAAKRLLHGGAAPNICDKKVCLFV